MRRPLLRLLEVALKEIGGPAPTLRWDRILLLNSNGSLNLRALGDAEEGTDRGFHLLLFCETGKALYYCKCRSRNLDGNDRREVRFLRFFRAHPSTRDIVPPQGHANDGRIDVQVTGFVGAPRMDQALVGLDDEGFHVILQDVQSASFRLSRAALEYDATLGGYLEIRKEAEPLLRELPLIGVSSEVADLLRQELARIEKVPALPQHRDLWPNNVFVHNDGRCTIVDFDHFGLVRVPLHDTCHLLRTASEAAGRMTAGPWFERVLDGDPTVHAVVRSAGSVLGLTPRQIGGCLVYYLLDIAVGTFRRGGPEEFWGRFRDELPVVAEFLAIHRDIGALGELLS
jgi:hypothetical protein